MALTSLTVSGMEAFSSPSLQRMRRTSSSDVQNVLTGLSPLGQSNLEVKRVLALSNETCLLIVDVVLLLL